MMTKIVNADYDLELELPGIESMTDDEFFNFCVQNKNTKIERDQKHQIYIMPPAGVGSSGKNGKLSAKIFNWNEKFKLGEAFDSSAGFYLPDTSMLSPDASWMNNKKWDAIPNYEKEKFPYTVPDFVVELMSPTDRLKAAKQKMTKWIENGVLLGWLINPKTETTTIYRADGTVENVIGFDKKLSGEDVLPGLEIDLGILK